MEFKIERNFNGYVCSELGIHIKKKIFKWSLYPMWDSNSQIHKPEIKSSVVHEVSEPAWHSHSKTFEKNSER